MIFEKLKYKFLISIFKNKIKNPSDRHKAAGHKQQATGIKDN